MNFNYVLWISEKVLHVPNRRFSIFEDIPIKIVYLIFLKTEFKIHNHCQKHEL